MAKSQFTVSKKLYGRDEEIKRLNDIFIRICRGEGEIVLVPGHSGVGKTSLVHTLQKPIKGNNGWYVQGKFNQYQQGVPYFAFRQALGQIWQEMLSSDFRTPEEWVNEIQQITGELTYLLADLIPDLRKHLDVPMTPDSISPQEARHRFARIIQSFLLIACKPEHPVMMIIDDWQWADHASLDLLRELDIGNELRYFMLVMAYRDDEIGTDHPLNPALADLSRKHIPLTIIAVGNLDKEAIAEFVSGNLKPHVQRLEELTATLLSLTDGNPLYIKSFMEYAFECELLHLDQEDDLWKWCFTDQESPSDIIDLFARRLRRFNQSEQKILSLAACIGNSFDLRTLSIVSNLCLDNAEAALRSPLSSDMIKEITPTLHGTHGNTNKEFVFFHDRIQQAAFQLIPEDDLARTRLSIGRLMQQKLSPQRQDELSFEIVGHLNHGSSLMDKEDEIVNLIKLNVSVAKKARLATAYGSMLEHYRMAVTLSECLEGGWDLLSHESHQFVVEILQGWGEGEFLEGDPQTGEKAIIRAVEYAQSAVERAEILNSLIVNYTLLARYEDAINTGRKALAELGILLPEGDFDNARDQAIAEVRKALAGREILSLADSPLMTDLAMKTATKLLITMGPPCYRTHQKLWSVMVPMVVRITIEYGLIPEVGYSHTAYGGLLGWVENNYGDAKDFGEVACRVMESKFDQPSYRSIFYLMVGSSTRHWFHHLSESTEDYQKAYEIGLRSGNLQYAAYGFGHDMYCCFFRGIPLSDLIIQSEQSLKFSQSRKNVWAIDLLEGGLRLFSILQNSEGVAEQIMQDDNYRHQIDRNHNIQVRCIYQILKTQCLLILGCHQQALELSLQTDPLLYTVGTQGLLPWPEHIFTRFLLLSALYEEIKEEDNTCKEQMEHILSQLQIWSEYSPDNYWHKLLFASAEYEALFSPSLATIDKYDKAISEATEYGFHQWAGYMNERAYNFLQTNSLAGLAHAYKLESYRCYTEWGANAKIKQIEVKIADDISFAQMTHDNSEDGDLQGRIIQKHIQLLRSYSDNAQSARHEQAQADVCDELAQATERLRVEVLKHRETESSLRESQQLLEITQNIGKIGGWALNLDTMKLNWTHQTFVIHELDSEHEPDLERAIEYYQPGSKEQLKDALKLLIDKNKPFNLKLKIKTEKDIERDVHVLGNADPESNAIYGVIQDISEYVTLEQQFQESEKMRVIGQLAGGIAHDFNNQLSCVIGYAEMLGDLLNDPQLKKYCDNILVGACRSADLTKKLLAFSRKGRYVTTPVNIHDLLNEVITILSHSIGKDVSFHTNFKAQSFMVMGDTSQLQSAIMNLALNARDAMPDGGAITLETSNVATDKICPKDDQLPKDCQYVKLSVSDTGIGMDEKICSQIFEPFFTTKEVGQGTGMGLAAVYGTIKNHEGCICVDSACGKGSTFTICLPTYQKPYPSEEGLQVEEPSPLRIMVVDDEDLFRKLAKDILESEKHHVVAFSDGVDAVEYYKSNWRNVDIIILDIVMPGLNGKQVFQKIKQINPDALVILASGYSIEGEAQDVIEMGAQAFLQKPFLKSDLDKVINEVSEHLLRIST